MPFFQHFAFDIVVVFRSFQLRLSLESVYYGGISLYGVTDHCKQKKSEASLVSTLTKSGKPKAISLCTRPFTIWRKSRCENQQTQRKLILTKHGCSGAGRFGSDDKGGSFKMAALL